MIARMMLGLRGLLEFSPIKESADALNHQSASGRHPVQAVAAESHPVLGRRRQALVGDNDSTTIAQLLKSFLQMNLFPRCGLHMIRFVPATSRLLQVDTKRDLERSAASCQAHGFAVADCSVLPGDLAQGLIQESNTHDCDLIALGDSGRGRWAHRLLGDSSVHVVRSSDRPLCLSH